MYREWYSRCYLPHFDSGEVTQSVTFHLADSYPTAMLAQWKEELAHLDAKTADVERRKRIEVWLDAGHGEAWLRHPQVAAMVEQALCFFDGSRYRLHAWVIMPNHVHTLSTLIIPFTLERILHSWKSYTSHEANKIMGRDGEFWFPDFYDRYIRNEEHFTRAKAYIENNPVKAGLCTAPEDWPWSSASRERERPTRPSNYNNRHQ